MKNILFLVIAVSVLLGAPKISSAALLFTDSFESGSISPEYDNTWALCCDWSSEVVTAPVRYGNYAHKLELRRYDYLEPGHISSGARAELALQKYAGGEGDERWFGFSFYLPSGWIYDTEPEIIAQWWDPPDSGEDYKSPSLALYTDGDKLKIQHIWDPNEITLGNEFGPGGGYQVFDAGSLNDMVGKWVDIVVHVKWSYTSSGILEIWRNGTKIVSKNGPNTYNDDYDKHFRVSIYKWTWADDDSVSIVTKRVVYHDEIRVGDASSNYNEVAPRSGGTVPPVSNEVAWWKFDETSGLTASDSSGNGNTGTLQNGPAWTAGKHGNALSFDGADDYMDTGDLFYSDAFSVCAWVNEDAAKPQAVIAAKRNSNGATAGVSEWNLALGSGIPFFQSWDAAGNLALSFGADISLSPNAWNHICAVQGGNGNNAYIYVNGTQRGSALQAAPMINTASIVQIGVRTNNADARYFSGLIDDVRIYGRALSSQEVQALYISSQNCSDSSAAWSTSPIPSQSGSFTFELDAIPLASGADALAALSPIQGTTYSDYAVIVRFNTTGYIDARNGGAYSSDTPVQYSANNQYHFRVPVDVPSRTYSVYVTPQGGQEQLLASSYAFRSEQASASQLSYWGHISEIGGQRVCNAGIKSQQYHRSDNNPADGCVSDTELFAFIDLWKVNSSDPTLRELMETIGLWKKGCS